MAKKIERNDPCWCGSGKKYKKCHEAFDEKMELMKKKGYAVLDHDPIKTPAQIEKIKESCKINVAVLDYVAEHIGPGVTTQQIDDWVHEETVRHGGIPAPLNYEGFPKSVCTSINEVVCHGIPDEEIVLKEGDIVNVDVSTIYQGYFSDSSRMFCIGEVSPEMQRLVQVTKECRDLGIQAARPWARLEVLIDINTELFFLQIAYMAIAGKYFIVLSEELLNGFCFCRRLDNDKVFLHKFLFYSDSSH